MQLARAAAHNLARGYMQQHLLLLPEEADADSQLVVEQHCQTCVTQTDFRFDSLSDLEVFGHLTSAL